jgi:hypothetical protein
MKRTANRSVKTKPPGRGEPRAPSPAIVKRTRDHGELAAQAQRAEGIVAPRAEPSRQGARRWTGDRRGKRKTH